MGNTKSTPHQDPLPEQLYKLMESNKCAIPNCNIDSVKIALDFYGFIMMSYGQIIQTTYNKRTFTFSVVNSTLECGFYDKLNNNHIVKWYDNDTVSIFLDAIRKWS
jgi:hypothetical protein